MAGHKVIVGLGKTGLACARYFAREGVPFAVVDANTAPDGLSELQRISPDAAVGELNATALLSADEIVLSPGVPLKNEAVQQAIANGIRVTGDVAMFGELADQPLVAITGSNGKSTVTAMVGALAAASGKRPGVGGNIGTPCLDLLAQDFDCYVLEVSSYQLEVATALPSDVAVVLNLSPDHLDRYDSVLDYYRTKAHIYRNARTAIVNRALEFAFEFRSDADVIDFGADEPAGDSSFGLRVAGGKTWLCRGDDNLISTGELPIRGGHNHLNALAALAIGSALDWDLPAMLDGLRAFRGLPHRSEYVGQSHGVTYINDSKATNIESTLAAIEGLAGESGPLTLILGGIGKGADFSRLVPVIKAHVARVFVFGRDRDLICSQLAEVSPVAFETLPEVMQAVHGSAQAGDWVLLAPACASLDQFSNFEARGDAFKRLAMGGVS